MSHFFPCCFAKFVRLLFVALFGDFHCADRSNLNKFCSSTFFGFVLVFIAHHCNLFAKSVHEQKGAKFAHVQQSPIANDGCFLMMDKPHSKSMILFS